MKKTKKTKKTSKKRSSKSTEKLVMWIGRDEVLVCCASCEKRMIKDWFTADGLGGRGVDEYERRASSNGVVQVTANMSAW